jgi:hypothetical protein
MNFNDILFYAHSGVRWLVVVMTLVALAWLILLAVRSGAYTAAANTVMRIWSTLVGIQWALGVILFIVLGGFDSGYRWEHALTLTIALVTAHVHYMLKKRPDRVRVIGGLVSVLVTLALIYVGVARLPQGWAM